MIQLQLQLMKKWPIHRPAPKFDDLSPDTQILETGIKVVDLIAPYVKGGKMVFSVVPV